MFVESLQYEYRWILWAIDFIFQLTRMLILFMIAKKKSLNIYKNVKQM